MLLQELFKPEYAELKNAYSIELNEESSQTEFATPPENLEEIGFVLKVDSENMMEENLMDIVISYGLTNLPVLIEVPSQLIASGQVEAKYLIHLSNNVGFSIALLPPGHTLVGDAISVEQYEEVVMNFLGEMLNKPNFDKFVYPISSFFEYLMLEKVLGEEKLKDFRPEHKYIQDNFANIMQKEDSDRFKAAIRLKLYDFYGGKESFDIVSSAIIEGLLNKSKEMYTDYVQAVTKNPTP